MIIVCSHHFRQLATKLKGYKNDLGQTYTKKNDKGFLEANIKDKFILLFSRENYGLSYKVGVMGKASLYTYDKLPSNELWIYKTENMNFDKIVVPYDSNLAELEFEKYLANILWEVDNSE